MLKNRELNYVKLGSFQFLTAITNQRFKTNGKEVFIIIGTCSKLKQEYCQELRNKEDPC